MTVRWETVQDIYIISKDLYIGKNKVENGNSSMVKPNRYCPNQGMKEHQELDRLICLLMVCIEDTASPISSAGKYRCLTTRNIGEGKRALICSICWILWLISRTWYWKEMWELALIAGTIWLQHTTGSYSCQKIHH